MKLFDIISNGDVYFIAEMSGNHGGSLEKAMEIVAAASVAGADCLKLQTYTADTITIDCDSSDFQTLKGLWQGRTLYDLYKEAYTPWEWQGEIKSECERLGMDFLSSVFDPHLSIFLSPSAAKRIKSRRPSWWTFPLSSTRPQKASPWSSPAAWARSRRSKMRSTPAIA